MWCALLPKMCCSSKSYLHRVCKQRTRHLHANGSRSSFEAAMPHCSHRTST
jgi:hypothetical protein